MPWPICALWVHFEAALLVSVHFRPQFGRRHRDPCAQCSEPWVCDLGPWLGGLGPRAPLPRRGRPGSFVLGPIQKRLLAFRKRPQTLPWCRLFMGKLVKLVHSKTVEKQICIQIKAKQSLMQHARLSTRIIYRVTIVPQYYMLNMEPLQKQEQQPIDQPSTLK